MAPHGSRSRYRHHGCRCPECHDALLADAKYQWALRVVRRGADPATRVSARTARRHLAELEASGLRRSHVAMAAGVSAATISRLARPTTKNISRITNDAVLGVVA